MTTPEGPQSGSEARTSAEIEATRERQLWTQNYCWHKQTSCCRTIDTTGTGRLQRSGFQDNATLQWTTDPWAAYSLLAFAYRQHLCKPFALSKRLCVRRQRTKKNSGRLADIVQYTVYPTHDVFYRGLCDIIRSGLVHTLLATSHYKTNDETSMLVFHANVGFQTQMPNYSVFMRVWCLDLVWQQRSINMEWWPSKKRILEKGAPSMIRESTQSMK